MSWYKGVNLILTLERDEVVTESTVLGVNAFQSVFQSPSIDMQKNGWFSGILNPGWGVESDIQASLQSITSHHLVLK